MSGQIVNDPPVPATKAAHQHGGSARGLLRGYGALLIAALIAACAPLLVLDSYSQRVVATAFMYLALAQAWNLIGGYAGLMSLAMPAFFGTGAMLTAALVVGGMSPLLAVGCGILAALLVAALVGGPTLRLQGHYFVVATLLITEALRNAVLNINAFGFSGSTTLNLFNATALGQLDAPQFNLFFYFVMLALALGAMIIVAAFERPRTGYALRSIRDNERAARALGVAVARQKMLVFLVSAGMTALVGAAWAFWLGAVDTNEAFGFRLSFDVIVMVFLGGRGSLWGPVAGVAVLTAVHETIGVSFPELHMVISGVLVALIVLFQPDGIASAMRDGLRAFAPARLRANLLRYRVK